MRYVIRRGNFKNKYFVWCTKQFGILLLKVPYLVFPASTSACRNLASRAPAGAATDQSLIFREPFTHLQLSPVEPRPYKAPIKNHTHNNSHI